MNILFLMDPLPSVHPQKDTTLALMVSAHERGHKVFFLPDGGISRVNAISQFHAVSLVPSFDQWNMFTHQKPVELNEDEVDAIFVRNDPPFDAQYLTNTWLLDLLPKHIAVINDPSGIRGTNEKIWASQFNDLLPPNCVSRDKKVLVDFVAGYGDVIAKPTDGYGGQSVFHIRKNESNNNVILETLSYQYSKEIILQKFIPEARDGDKRILLLNGEILGAVLRKQSEGDHRHNFLSGGKAYKTEVTVQDKRIVERLKPHLIERGLYFVGIDILGHYLTEVNVTSPTCLREMNELYSQTLHHQVIEFAEKLVEKKRQANTIKA